MELSISHGSDRTTAKINGKLTFKENQPFKQLVAKLFTNRESKTTCVFDLQDVEFIDSAGIGLLLIAKDKASSADIEIVLANAPEAARRIIQIARLDRIFTIE